jgi:hypothetical protein
MQKRSKDSKWIRRDCSSTNSLLSSGRLSTSKSTPINAKREYERYLNLANATAAIGDLIETENYYQHAEHYFRLMRESPV